MNGLKNYVKELINDSISACNYSKHQQAAGKITPYDGLVEACNSGAIIDYIIKNNLELDAPIKVSMNIPYGTGLIFEYSSGKEEVMLFDDEDRRVLIECCWSVL